MEEKIEKNELISFLKKIYENTLTKEIEVEVPLGLPHGVYTGIRPQTVKVDVKWLVKQVINELESPAKPIKTEEETKFPKFIRCKKLLNFLPIIIYEGEIFKVLGIYPNSENAIDEMILESVNNGIDFSLPIPFYYTYFEEID